MKRLQLILITLLLFQQSYASVQPEAVVKSFGEALSLWCRTDDISYREKIDILCSGSRKCRVEDNIHAEYQRGRGLTDYETFILDSYMNMFQTLMSQNIRFEMSNVKVGETDVMPDGELSFVTADIKVSGPINRTVTDLFLVREGKITGIYNYSSQLGFSHLNGNLIKTLQMGNYRYVERIVNGFAVVTDANDRCGLIDVKGNIVIPCKWDQVVYVGDSFAHGYNYKNDHESCVYDLRQGGKRTPFKKVSTWIVGREKIPTTFSEGLAVVYNQYDKCGFLNEFDLDYKNVSYDYDEATRFCDGYAMVKKNGIKQVINKKFKTILKENREYSLVDRPYEGTIKVKANNGKYGVIDLQGKAIIPCMYDRIGGFVNGLCQVTIYEDGYAIDDKTGFIDKLGKVVIPIGSISGCWSIGFEDGYIEATKDVPFDYYENGKVRKKTENRGSLIGTDGEPLPGFNWNYQDVRRFCDGLARFKKDNKYGFLNRNGEVTIPPIYFNASFFVNGYSCIGKELGNKTRYGCINTDGILVIPYIYDKSFQFDNGIALVVKDGKVGLIDVYGNSSF